MIDNHLVAFILSPIQIVKDAEHIKLELDKILPVYSVPKIFIEMAEFPLNQNGKIDRSALTQLYKEQLSNKTLQVF